MNNPLCEGISTTAGELLMMVLAVGRKHALTWDAIVDILRVCNYVFGNDTVPASKYTLAQIFPTQFEDFSYIVHCSTCHTRLFETKNLQNVEIECRVCGHTTENIQTSFFVCLDFKSQLKKLLQCSEVNSNLNYRNVREKVNEDCLEDILDGAMYREYLQRTELQNQWNVSYTFNTDGMSPGKNCHNKIWGLYVMLHELPPRIRENNKLLVGLWIDKTEPNMNLFLESFVQQANVLSEEGVKWNYNGDEITSKAFPLCCDVDAPARAMVLNMKRFNGKSGCNLCFHLTERVNSQRKYPLLEPPPLDRTHESMIRGMLLSNQNPENDNGHLGASVLMLLNKFDLVKGMIPDAMHAVFLGVVPNHTDLLLQRDRIVDGLSIQKCISVIDERLNSIRVPKCIPRIPIGISESGLWIASQWQGWLLRYCLLCLDGLIKAEYLNHLRLLVIAVYTLTKDSISQDDVAYAHECIVRYVFKFEEFFGKESMRFNVHTLLHLPQSVYDWGPLHAHNTFTFENENHFLLKLRKNPYRTSIEIIKKHLFYQSLRDAPSKFHLSEEVKNFRFTIPKTKRKYFFRK